MLANSRILYETFTLEPTEKLNRQWGEREAGVVFRGLTEAFIA